MSASCDEKSETELLRDLQKDIIKNHLDIIFLLRIRRKGALSGYDLLEYTNEKYKVTFSPGTIYAQLYILERKHLIEGNMDSSGKRTYSLTSQGLKIIDISKKEIEKVVASIFEE